MGAPEVGIWRIGTVGTKRFGTGTAGSSGTTAWAPLTMIFSMPGMAGPASTVALALPSTGIMPVMVPAASTVRTAEAVGGTFRAGPPALGNT